MTHPCLIVDTRVGLISGRLADPASAAAWLRGSEEVAQRHRCRDHEGTQEKSSKDSISGPPPAIGQGFLEPLNAILQSLLGGLVTEYLRVPNIRTVPNCN